MQMPPLSYGDALTLVCVIAAALANYFAMRAEIRIMRNEMAPIVSWWSRLATNAANRLFINTRADDRKSDSQSGNGS